jgi:hypothetical protein
MSATTNSLGDLQTAVHVAASFSIHGDGRSTGDRTTITSDDIDNMLQYANEPPYMDSSRGTIPTLYANQIGPWIPKAR